MARMHSVAPLFCANFIQFFSEIFSLSPYLRPTTHTTFRAPLPCIIPRFVPRIASPAECPVTACQAQNERGSESWLELETRELYTRRAPGHVLALQVSSTPFPVCTPPRLWRSWHPQSSLRYAMPRKPPRSDEDVRARHPSVFPAKTGSFFSFSDRVHRPRLCSRRRPTRVPASPGEEAAPPQARRAVSRLRVTHVVRLGDSGSATPHGHRTGPAEARHLVTSPGRQLASSMDPLSCAVRGCGPAD